MITIKGVGWMIRRIRFTSKDVIELLDHFKDQNLIDYNIVLEDIEKEYEDTVIYVTAKQTKETKGGKKNELDKTHKRKERSW